jgi:putative peptidoglycan lipid II flippase
MRYATVSLTANTLGSIGLFFLFRSLGLMPHLGIAVATTLGAWLNVGLLYGTLIKRGAFESDARLSRVLPLIVLASLVMGAALWLAAPAVRPLVGAPNGPLIRALALAGLVGAGLIVYAATVLALGILDRRQLGTLLARLKPRSPV